MTDGDRHGHMGNASMFVAAGTAVVGALAAAAQMLREHRAVLVAAGIVVAASVVGACVATSSRRRPRARAEIVAEMTDRLLAERIVALMRAGGWRRVTVTAPLGYLGTDVVAVAMDGRRWLMRCHRNSGRLEPSDVYRFADTARTFAAGT